MEARDGNIVFIDIGKAERKRHHEFCTELVEWARRHAAIVPTEQLKLDEVYTRKVLSEASVDTLGTAQAGGKAAVLEDRRLN